MTAANHRQIAGQENTVGLHYNRFWPLRRTAHKRNQWLVSQKKSNIPRIGRESAKFG
jgi:hypothetical protein